MRIAPIFAVRAILARSRRLGLPTREYPGGRYGFASLDGVEIPLELVPHIDAKVACSAAYRFVDATDQLAETWRATGVDAGLPADTEWGQHEGALVDPDGNMIRFGSLMAPLYDAER